MGFLKNKLLYLVFLAVAVRIFFSFLPAFEYDQNDFRFWSYRLTDLGPQHFYSKDVFTNNPIGFLYILWGVGLIKARLLGNFIFFQENRNFDLLLKLPANIGDIATALLIYLIIKRRFRRNWGILGFSLYVFNPAIIFDSAIWGQYDGIATFFLVLSVYFLTIKRSPELSVVFTAISWVFKPQTIAFGPILFLLIILTTKPQRWFLSLLTMITTLIFIYLPFFPYNPIYGLIYTNTASTNLFNCTTCFAFNFWGIFGNWKNDLKIILGIPLLNIGIILLSISYVLIFLLKPFKKRFQEPFIYLTTAISLISFFMLLTRIHERYIFPFFAFFLIGSILLQSKKLIILYLISSLIFLINLYLPYTYYNKQLIFDKNFIQILLNNFSVISLLSFISFIIIMFYYQLIMKGELK